jgi:hypothetical protein
VVSAVLALSERMPVSGRDFLNAVVLGIETECRIGNAVYPNHYDIGWHITGTAGVFGAAAAAGKLLGLSEQQTAPAGAPSGRRGRSGLPSACAREWLSEAYRPLAAPGAAPHLVLCTVAHSQPGPAVLGLQQPFDHAFPL